jgi:hypothetical protein
MIWWVIILWIWIWCVIHIENKNARIKYSNKILKWWKKNEKMKKKKCSIYARCFNYDFLNVWMRRESFFFQHIFMFENDENHFSFNIFTFWNAMRIIFLSTRLRFRMQRKSRLSNLNVRMRRESIFFNTFTFWNATRIIFFFSTFSFSNAAKISFFKFKCSNAMKIIFLSTYLHFEMRRESFFF